MTTYTTRSNAARAARKLGVPFEIVEQAGKFAIVTAAPAQAAQPAEFLALSLEGEDLGTVPAADAFQQAQDAANEFGAVVTIRNATTDEIVDEVSPTTPTEPAQVEAPVEAEAPVEQAEPVAERDFAGEITRLKHQHTEELARLKQRHAEEMGLLKLQAAAAKANTKATRAPRASGQPNGKTAECIALALRPEGVTVAELNELTQWKGAPWSWNFSNPKGTGWSQKYGYGFRSAKGDDKRVRYYLTTQA